VEDFYDPRFLRRVEAARQSARFEDLANNGGFDDTL
jgi:hypothetical protein